MSFQLCQITFGNASGIQKFLSAVALRNGNLQRVFIDLDGLRCIKNLNVNLSNRFLNTILGRFYIQIGCLIVQLLLFDGVQSLATIINGPRSIQTVIAIVTGLAGCLDHLASADRSA